MSRGEGGEDAGSSPQELGPEGQEVSLYITQQEWASSGLTISRGHVGLLTVFNLRSYKTKDLIIIFFARKINKESYYGIGKYWYIIAKKCRSVAPRHVF